MQIGYSRRLAMLVGSLAVGCLFSAQSLEASIIDGTIVRISRANGPDGTPGAYGNNDPTYGGAVGAGEFRVTVPTDGPVPILFKTFCLEFNEFISTGSEYKASINKGAILGGVSGGVGGIDYLSGATQWFYGSYRASLLDSFTDFSYDSKNSSDALQLIFWRLEGEIQETEWKAFGKNSFLGNTDTRNIADNLWSYYTNNKGWLDGYQDPNVKVLNLWKKSSDLDYSLLDSSEDYRLSSAVSRARKQSQLYYHGPPTIVQAVPEPSTCIVWGGLAVFSLISLRRRRNKQ